MVMDINEALAVVAAFNVPYETALKMGTSQPPEKLYMAALAIVTAEASRIEKFFAQFGDMNGDS